MLTTFIKLLLEVCVGLGIIGWLVLIFVRRSPHQSQPETVAQVTISQIESQFNTVGAAIAALSPVGLQRETIQTIANQLSVELANARQLVLDQAEVFPTTVQSEVLLYFDALTAYTNFLDALLKMPSNQSFAMQQLLSRIVISGLYQLQILGTICLMILHQIVLNNGPKFTESQTAFRQTYHQLQTALPSLKTSEAGLRTNLLVSGSQP